MDEVEAQEIDRLRRELVRRQRELDAVRRISAALHSKLSTADLVRETLQVAADVVDAVAGSILLYDPKRGKLLFQYVLGEKAGELSGMEMEATQGIAGQVLQTGEARISPDVSAEAAHYPDIDRQLHHVTRNMVTVPLDSVDGTKIGVMQILNKRTGTFDGEDLAVLTILGGHAATAIETARLYEEAKLATVVKVMGDISHDVKNMITPISTCAQTLEIMFQAYYDDLQGLLSRATPGEEGLAKRVEEVGSELEAFYPEAIAMICDGGTAVQERVREIADCVKGIVAKPQFEVAQVEQVVEKVVKALRPVAGRASVALVLEFSPDVPPLRIDQKQIYNAVYNLVNNAIPETGEGGSITVRVTFEPDGQFPGGEHVLIAVADTGRGMPEHVRARLFSDDAISTKPGGTGLGTRIVKNVVEAHQGLVSVESQEGKGTTFYIRLPYRQTVAGGEEPRRAEL